MRSIIVSTRSRRSSASSVPPRRDFAFSREPIGTIATMRGSRRSSSIALIVRSGRPRGKFTHSGRDAVLGISPGGPGNSARVRRPAHSATQLLDAKNGIAARRQKSGALSPTAALSPARSRRARTRENRARDPVDPAQRRQRHPRLGTDRRQQRQHRPTTTPSRRTPRASAARRPRRCRRRTRGPAKIAANERIVIGFVIVSPKIERNAPPSPGRSAASATSRGSARHRPPGEIDEERAADQPEHRRARRRAPTSPPSDRTPRSRRTSRRRAPRPCPTRARTRARARASGG